MNPFGWTLPGSADDAWLLATLLAGAGSVAVFAHLLAAFILSDTDRADRRYLDPAPLAWRIAWPLVLPLSRALGRTMPASRRTARNAQLQRAGLGYALNAEQFAAGRLLATGLATALVLLLWSPAGVAPLPVIVGAALAGHILPATWLRDRIAKRSRAVLRQLPFLLDVITLAVESGMNLTGALDQAVDKGPPGPLRAELERALRDLRAGRGRDEALRGLAARLAMPAVGSLVAALLLAEKQGTALGPVLRAQAEQRRHERFLRAEKLAMEAPVKMLPPLLLFIFPCTFVVLLFPIISRFIEEGWLQ